VRQLGENLEVLTLVVREDDEAGLGGNSQIRRAKIDGVAELSSLENLVGVDADDESRRPDLTRGEGERGAHAAEANDRDLIDDRCAPGRASRLNQVKGTRHRKVMLRQSRHGINSCAAPRRCFLTMGRFSAIR
jgi:hypothetical protein